MIRLTGFDHRVFWDLLSVYTPIHDCVCVDRDTGVIKLKDPKKGGRRRNLDATASLALLLAWTRTRGSNHLLTMVFGQTLSPLNHWLKLGRRVMYRALKADPRGRVAMPKADRIEGYVGAIAAKYPVLGSKRVGFALDGLKLHVEKAGSEYEQAKYYNAWTHDHYV